MQPRIQIKHPKGDIQLIVTHPQGLVSGFEPKREDYCLVFVPAKRGQAIYDGMDVGASVHVGFILENHFRVHEYEVPLVAREHDGAAFRVRNDAHVLAALVAAGVDPVPVVVNIADAAKV